MKDKQELIDHMNKFMFERTYPEGVMLEILTELERIGSLSTLDVLPDKMPFWFDRFMGLKKDLWEELRKYYGIGKVNHTITIVGETHLVPMPKEMPKSFLVNLGMEFRLDQWKRLYEEFGSPNVLWWHERNLNGKTVRYKNDSLKIDTEFVLNGKIGLGESERNLFLELEYCTPCIEKSIEEKILAKLDDEGKAMFEKFIKEKGHE